MKSNPAWGAALAAATVLTGGSEASPLNLRQDNSTNSAINFTQIEPSAEWNWVPCYENFTCMNLIVPLDYADESAGETNIAFIKFNSENEDAEDILLNPGGPGGSGVDDLQLSVSVYAKRLGSQYNLVSFDPRGVGYSGPSLSCFPEEAGGVFEGNIFYEDVFTPVDNSNEFKLAQSFERAGAFGSWCTGVLAENGTAKYASSSAVAQDMIHYIEFRAESLGKPKEEAKVWYYGLSYGTALGGTFATMFPDRIGRFILDGVIDLDSYYNQGWKTSTISTDDALSSLWDYCFVAGPELCAFHKGAKSPKELEDRFKKILDSLKKSPVYVANVNTGLPVAVNYEDVLIYTTGDLYGSWQKFPSLAQAFADAEEGNFTMFAVKDGETNFLVPLPNNYESRSSRGGISCLDNGGKFNTSTLEEYTEHVNYMIEKSYIGGGFLAAITGAACRNYNIFPPESQTFKADKLGADEVSNPILFIGNLRDPVTPHADAETMQGRFPGSGLLSVNMTGHTSIGAKTDCIDKAFQAYMADLTMPEEGTLCQPEQIPFEWVPSEEE